MKNEDKNQDEKFQLHQKIQSHLKVLSTHYAYKWSVFVILLQQLHLDNF